MYKGTYSDGDFKNMWDSIFMACELLRTLAKDVARNLKYAYPIDEDINMTGHLKQVINLPSDAQQIY